MLLGIDNFSFPKTLWINNSLKFVKAAPVIFNFIFYIKS